jgi:hypothetical protein
LGLGGDGVHWAQCEAHLDGDVYLGTAREARIELGPCCRTWIGNGDGWSLPGVNGYLGTYPVLICASKFCCAWACLEAFLGASTRDWGLGIWRAERPCWRRGGGHTSEYSQASSCH